MNKLSILLSALLAGFLLSGCVKKAFDNPPDYSHTDPGVPAGTTLISIKDLKAMNGPYTYSNGGDTTLVQQDVSIAAIVTADDRSGNLYKVINIEDSTGGIQLLVDAYSLYNQYPVGRKIYVKCKGLMLGYNAGIPELGMGVNEQLAIGGINGGQIEAHIIKADVGHEVTPITVTLAQIASFNPNNAANQALLARLIKIDDVEFKVTDRTYAQPNDNTNRTIKNCGKDTIAMRTSNYANFAAVPLPMGHGSIVGVYTIYTSGNPSTGAVSKIYPQLIIRDTGDVKFYGTRCDGTTSGGGGGGTTVPVVSLDSLRKLYTGSNIKLGSYSIHGTVISDAGNGNVTTNNIIIQDGNRGISVYGLTGTFNMGDSLVIDVSGDSLLNYKGALEIKIVGGSTVNKAASNVPVTPRVATIADIVNNYSNYEYTLVKIMNATSAQAGSTYSGNKTLSDGSGSSITLYTATGAAFASQSVPSGAHNWTGIVSQFNTTKQLQLRNPAIDVQ